ncbi:unnamed protein product [Schistosoma mattheei]|uniref:Uncharacterized protein n=1 Tax=Schistosoma mattheei TaxID=31246 RepID=A0A183PSW5_9TREM|nr:unnamed protein product [Schistosoma mattheei]
MNDYVNKIEPENTKYSLFQLHPSSCTAMETEVETKSISRLETSSKKTTLSIFSDENLTLCNAEKLEIMNFIPSFKGVSSFHLCSFDDEKEKCISPHFLCVASDSSYISINLRTNSTTELLRSVKEPVRNYIVYFTQNEFIVSGPGSLGIIVDANGVSHRAPLQLSPNIVEVFVWRNYFFTITDEFFTIHKSKSCF